MNKINLNKLQNYEKQLLIDTIGERLQRLTATKETYYKNITLFHELKNLYETIKESIT